MWLRGSLFTKRKRTKTSTLSYFPFPKRAKIILPICLEESGDEDLSSSGDVLGEGLALDALSDHGAEDTEHGGAAL